MLQEEWYSIFEKETHHQDHNPQKYYSMMSHKRAPPQSKPAPNSLTSLTARDNSMAAAFAAATSNGEQPSYNPVSKWQEHVEVPGLTLFDIHREPRQANSDPWARVRVQLKVRLLSFWIFHDCILGQTIVVWYVINNSYFSGSFPWIPLLRLSIVHQEHENCKGMPPSLLQRLYRKVSSYRKERMSPVSHPHPEPTQLTSWRELR